MSTYLTKKAFEVASAVFQRRGLEFSQQDAEILEQVFKMTNKHRPA
jgi:hypothetical protein